jgi:hypothetical protein
VCDCRTAKKRPKETDEPDHHCFLPLRPEDHGIEFRTGQERQDDCTGTRKKRNPFGARTEANRANKRANDQLRDSPNNDFRQRCRDFEPDRQKGSDKRQSNPQGS